MKNVNESKMMLYMSWVNQNKWVHAKYLLIASIGFMSVLIPFDYLLFENGGKYPPIRIMFISFMSFGLVIYTFLNKLKNTRLQQLVLSLLIITPVLGFNLVYQAFIYSETEKDLLSIVYFANFMVIFFSTFMVHKFRFEQSVMNGVSSVVLMAMFFNNPQSSKPLLLLVITHISSALVAVYFRHEFIQNIKDRFRSLSSFLPKQIAHFIVTSNEKYSIENAFKARDRFTVCLCADWRQYQKLFSAHGPDHISAVTELFYDKVFDSLDEIVPSGQYFANWTADELFIVFYNENGENEKTLMDALKFAKALSTEIFLDVRFEFDIDLKFDIGLSSGMGYLGVQGPKKMKKTTITGLTAGRAKRMESEAKSLRRESKLLKNKQSENPNPILMIDDQLYKISIEKSIFAESDFKKHIAKSKDIEGQEFFTFQSNFIDVYQVSQDEKKKVA